MDYKKLISSLLVLLAVAQFHAGAEQVSAGAAQAMANGFIKSHFKSMPGSLKAPAMSDIVLAYAEPSDKVAQANVYYFFNIKGGGFIIVSGEDHATPVLGYSDDGRVDVNNMSGPLKEMLGIYKAEIEYLLTHKIDAPQSFTASLKESTTIVAPLTHTTWGPESPFNTLCPTSPSTGNYSLVGCVAVAQAQYVYFWRYPLSCDSIPSYYGNNLKMTIPALPPTTFEFDKMLLSYGYWDFDNKRFVHGDYTDEQAYEVAKLCRYCGQASKTNYSPGSSTSGGLLTGLKLIGYSNQGKVIVLSNYTLDEWEEILRQRLDEDKPILYAGQGTGSPGHAFICDGYTDDSYFHMNMGWYGYNNGWYILSAFSFVNRYGKYRIYDGYQKANLYIDPPLFCTVTTEINASKNLILLGQTFNPCAMAVDLYMTYRTLHFMFSLTDVAGNQIAVSDSITLRRIIFENGTDISLAFKLPKSLPEGRYNLHFNYHAEENAPLISVATAPGQLTVLGKFAKYGAPFDITDVVDAIDYILYGTSDGTDINIADLTDLVDYLLE